ncbi:MAG: hypothetical protein IJD28_08305, partial [Deferribacterales bacterium]|nr:hypothetical protein [Deferribacterales bacterium]
MKTSFTKSSLKKISKKLRHSETLTDEDEVIFSEYRKVHKYILNNFQSKIRKRIKGNKKYRYVLFAQRLKRRKTIINKIRNRFSEMDLSRMHDIAGGRIIFPNIELLKKFRKEFLNSQKKSKKYTHVSGDKYDYITNPNIKTGYRGIHDIFREITQDSIKTEI